MARGHYGVYAQEILSHKLSLVRNGVRTGKRGNEPIRAFTFSAGTRSSSRMVKPLDERCDPLPVHAAETASPPPLVLLARSATRRYRDARTGRSDSPQIFSMGCRRSRLSTVRAHHHACDELSREGTGQRLIGSTSLGVARASASFPTQSLPIQAH